MSDSVTVRKVPGVPSVTRALRGALALLALLPWVTPRLHAYPVPAVTADTTNLTSTARVHPLYLEEDRWGGYTGWSVRDRQGFLWLATDNGLKRYDGYNFRVYTADSTREGSIGSAAIRFLMLQRKNGALWAAGGNLNRYHVATDSFTTYNVSNLAHIRDIHEDQDGLFWIGGEGFGLVRFSPNNGEILERLFLNTDDAHIWSIEPRRGTRQLWLATAGGLVLFDTVSRDLKRYYLPIDLNTGMEVIRAVAEDDQGRVWIATLQGLFMLDPATGAYRHYDGANMGLTNDVLWSVMTDSHGQVWASTDKQGVVKYLPETDNFLHFPASAYDPHRFPRGAIPHMHEDHEGHIWFSAGNYGVYRLSEHLEKFRAYTHSSEYQDSLAFNNVLGLLEDRDGYIWVATDGGGLDRFDPRTNRFTHYRHDPNDPESLSSDAVISLAQDSRGYIWAGTWGGGLSRLDPATGKFSTLQRDPDAPPERTLADNNIFRIVVDKNDRLLLSVWRRGLQIYDQKAGLFESYLPLADTSNSGIRSESINDILPTADGKYWIAGYKGLELFSPETGKFTSPEIPINEAISDLHLDDAGFLWVATNKNLLRYNPATHATEFFTTHDGLSDEFVVSIEQDDKGFLWLGTRNGINRFDPRTKEIKTFDELDGLPGSQFNRFSHLKTRSGWMYFGGTQGLTAFNPNDLPRNEYPPQVHFIGGQIDQNSLDPRVTGGPDVVLNHLKQLNLTSKQRSLELRFTATGLVSPGKNQFRYRLLGLENEWNTVDSKQRQVRYSNLPHGTYRFQVLASNNEGVWGAKAKELVVDVAPAWWHTWWARSLYLLLFIMSTYAFSYWRLASNRRRERQLEVLVSEQTSKLKEANRSIIHLNTELEQRVAHRTRELSMEIEERRESEAKANYIAYHDALTGLYNRAWLLNHLAGLIKEVQEGSGRFALLFVGGDRFRKINDTYGHLQGDLLLKAMSERLLDILPDGGHAVRLGSDEFTIVVDEIKATHSVERLAAQITAAFREQFFIEKVRMSLSVSVGFVVCDNTYVDPSQVLRNANIAMQKAKDRGRGVWQMFDDEILQQTLDMAALEVDLKQALARGQFSVVYQPIIMVETGYLNGFEVLLRWRHPERGMVPPDRFIGLAESLGLIFDIGLWVLETACVQLKAWQESLSLVKLPTIAVNLSPVQLEHVDLLEHIDEVFRRTGVSRSNIKFEITESALLKHTDTVDGLLESLRERGIELAIDDFGTGYSSLSYLDKLPVQVLKIDRTFVNALTETRNNSGAHEIVRATISLAHNLNMRVVAEGIETQDQLDALHSYGCDYGQGYFIARPMSPEDAAVFLANATLGSFPDERSINNS